MASKIMNFLSRKCWKKVLQSIPKKDERTIMKIIWQFKNKLEEDKSIRHKSWACTKGDEQAPGKDYMESFSPVAMDSSVIMGITIYLFYVDCYDDLT
jgi:hypothetical protein